jgi:hypothetical protein
VYDVSDHVDIELFVRTNGSFRVLAAVGEAFMLQSGPWRVALRKNTKSFNREQLVYLVHKMKGSCFTVCAMGAAEEFRCAEIDFPQMTKVDWEPLAHKLTRLVAEVELELQAVILCSKSEPAN